MNLLMTHGTMKKLGVKLIYIPILVVLCEFIYWTTMDWLIFNPVALENGIGIAYYSSAALVALTLAFAQSRLVNRMHIFLNYLISVLTNTYILFSVNQLYGVYCEDIKNLSSAYNSFNIIILLVVGYLVIFKILPKLKWIDFLVIAISTVLLFVDFLFLLYGYKVFYPGYW